MRLMDFVINIIYIQPTEIMYLRIFTTIYEILFHFSINEGIFQQLITPK